MTSNVYASVNDREIKDNILLLDLDREIGITIKGFSKFHINWKDVQEKSQKDLKIFISYSIEDEPKALKLYERLHTEGFSPWIDSKNLFAGQSWDYEISSAIRDSDVIIICLSKNAIQKEGYVQKEIRFTLDVVDEKPDGTTTVIPVRLDDSDVPSYLSNWQSISIFSETDWNEAGWQKLLQSLVITAKFYGLKNYSFEEFVNKKEAVNAQEQIISLKENQYKDIVEEERIPRQQFFIAMPFSEDVEDVYWYGIKRAVDSAGYSCYRSDKESFVGDI